MKRNRVQGLRCLSSSSIMAAIQGKIVNGQSERYLVRRQDSKSDSSSSFPCPRQLWRIRGNGIGHEFGRSYYLEDVWVGVSFQHLLRIVDWSLQGRDEQRLKFGRSPRLTFNPREQAIWVYTVINNGKNAISPGFLILVYYDKITKPVSKSAILPVIMGT